MPGIALLEGTIGDSTLRHLTMASFDGSPFPTGYDFGNSQYNYGPREGLLYVEHALYWPAPNAQIKRMKRMMAHLINTREQISFFTDTRQSFQGAVKIEKADCITALARLLHVSGNQYPDPDALNVQSMTHEDEVAEHVRRIARNKDGIWHTVGGHGIRAFHSEAGDIAYEAVLEALREDLRDAAEFESDFSCTPDKLDL